MNVRVQLGLLIAVCLLANQPACAQQYQSQGHQPQGYGPSANQYQDQVTQAGFHHHGAAPQQYVGAECDDLTRYQLLPDDRGFLYDRDSLFDLTILEQSKGTWIRAEVWNARLSNRSGRVLGSQALQTMPVSGLNSAGRRVFVDNTQQFDLAAADSSGAFTLANLAAFPSIPVEAASTHNLNFEDMTGVQLTMGIPLTKRSWLEAGAWGIEDTTLQLDTPMIPPSSVLGAFGLPRTVAIVVPLTTNGQVGNRIIDPATGSLLNRDRVIVYDNSYFSSYKINTWSAEVNYVHDYISSTSGFSLKPMIGYNYTEYNEDLSFGGSFNNTSGYLDLDPLLVGPGILATPVESSITSNAENSRSELRLGFRSELNSKWLSLGVEPKVGMGLNFVQGQVTADNVRAPGDIGLLDPALSTITDNGMVMTTTADDVEFSATFDLGLYANFHLHERFNLRVGYDLIYLANLGVADNQIRYNENSVTVVDPLDPTIVTTTSTADVGYAKGLKSRAITAFTIGGEVILW